MVEVGHVLKALKWFDPHHTLDRANVDIGQKFTYGKFASIWQKSFVELKYRLKYKLIRHLKV